MNITKEYIDQHETEALLERSVAISVNGKEKVKEKVKHLIFFTKYVEVEKDVKYTFNVFPLKGAQQFKILNRLSHLDEAPFHNGENVMSIYSKMIINHFHDVVYCVAAMLCSPKEEPSQWLLDLVANEMDNDDYERIWTIGFKQMNIGPFLNGIVLMKGIKIETNPIG